MPTVMIWVDYLYKGFLKVSDLYSNRLIYKRENRREREERENGEGAGEKGKEEKRSRREGDRGEEEKG